MSIKIYGINEKQKWDEIVKSFKRYDVYYLSGYVKAFKVNGDGEPILICIKNSNTRMINVVMKRDISEIKYFANIVSKGNFFDFITPYGYGGPLIEGNDFEDLFNQYNEFCKNNNIVSEFVRFHPLLRNSSQCSSFYKVIDLGDTVHLDISDEEIIWTNITSKNRNMIRKAQKNGLKVYYGINEKLIQKFIDIYNKTMERDAAEDYYFFPKQFYKSIVDDLHNNALFFYVKLNEEVIAISIILFANNKMHYHLSGALYEKRNLAPTNLLLYEAAKWGNAHGCKVFHLGGGVGSSRDNLYKFKESFNRSKEGKTVFSIGQKIYNQSIYEKLVQLRSVNDSDFDEKSSFFPSYRS